MYAYEKVKSVCLFDHADLFSFHVTAKTYTVKGRSDLTNIKFTIKYKTEIPPNLFGEVAFSDDNNNGVLEAKEDAQITISIINKGLGPAQEVTVKISDSLKDPQIYFPNNNKVIPIIYPGRTEKVILRIHAGMDVRTAKNKFSIIIDERNGYGCDSATLYLNTMTFQEPKMVVAGLQVVDDTKDCSPITPDAKMQAGEVVMVKVTLQNQGQNISEGTKYSVISNDPRVRIFRGDSGSLGILQSGRPRTSGFN